MANRAGLGHDASPVDNERVLERGVESLRSVETPTHHGNCRFAFRVSLGDWATTHSARRYWLSILPDGKAGRNRFLENTAFSGPPDLRTDAILYRRALESCSD
jgi:hypothetical protein